MREILVYRRVGGSNGHPETRKFAVVAYALVDDHRYVELNQFRWGLHPDGRALRMKGKSVVYMHAVVAGYKAPDHIDGNPLNNQESNFRPANHSQNAMNKKKQRGGTSRFKGVCWLKRNSKWNAEIRINGKLYRLGCFTDETEAARAYDAKARELFGDRARLNFPV